MILSDGVRYVLRTPAKEETLEDMVREHVKDIWGLDAYYFDKKKLLTASGVGSIPDGYVVLFGNTPQWYVVEVELASHNLYEHILPQVSKFANGVQNASSRQLIVDAIWRTTKEDEVLKVWAKAKIAPSEVHEYLSDVVAKPPILSVIFEEIPPQWDEVRSQLGQGFKSVEERVFQTYVREGCDLNVHAHVFDPVQTSATVKKTSEKPGSHIGPLMESKDAPGQHVTPSAGTTRDVVYKGGKYHLEVVATNSGIRYRCSGVDYSSPSAAARSITNASVNGWKFWKLA